MRIRLLLSLLIAIIAATPGRSQTFRGLTVNSIFTCLATNLFDPNQPFTSVAEITSSEGILQNYTAGISMQDGNLRIYIDMAKMKEGLGSPEQTKKIVEARRKEGLSRLVVIVRPGDRTRYVLFPDRRTYHTNSLDMLIPSFDSNAQLELRRVTVGEETIAGQKCRKSEWQLLDGKEKTTLITEWSTVDQKRFPVQLQLLSDMTLRFGRLKFENLDPALFEVPADYKCLDSIEDVAAEARVGTRPSPAPAPTRAETKAATEARVLKWHQELAEKGEPFGEYKMGLRYRDGDGVPKDVEKARDYLQRATDRGDKDAAAALAKLPPQKVAAAASGTKIPFDVVSIVSARFGMGDKMEDVTARVIELLRTKSRGFSPTGQTLGIDPLPGKKKRLVIQYEYKGASHSLTVQAPKTVSVQSLERNAAK